jgi:hypothetical protein
MGRNVFVIGKDQPPDGIPGIDFASVLAITQKSDTVGRDAVFVVLFCQG